MKTRILNNKYNWLIGLLLIGNLITLGFFWWNRPHPPFSPNRGPRDFLIKELELTSTQQEEYQNLIELHQKAVRTVKENIAHEREQFYDLLKNPLRSDSVTFAQANKISLAIREIELIHLNHFEALRKLCNDTQKKKFDELLHQLSQLIIQNNEQAKRPPPPPDLR